MAASFVCCLTAAVSYFEVRSGCRRVWTQYLPPPPLFSPQFIGNDIAAVQHSSKYVSYIRIKLCASGHVCCCEWITAVVVLTGMILCWFIYEKEEINERLGMGLIDSENQTYKHTLFNKLVSNSISSTRAPETFPTSASFFSRIFRA